MNLPTHPLSLLIVEDERIIRQGIRVMVENTAPHLHVDEANNGAVALEMFAKKRYDIMLMDINMPHLNGIEMVQKISPIGDTCIIVISGFDDFSYAVEMLRHGAMEYLLKPIDRHKLRNALNNAQNTIAQARARSAQEREHLSLQLKYYLKDKLSDGDKANLLKSFDGFFATTPYKIVCTEETLYAQGVEIGFEVYGYNIYITTSDYLPTGTLFHLSISDIYIGAKNLRAAYAQATKRYIEKTTNNEKKIQEALRYIEKNFTKPLDMAIISNYVNMNYTLFSNLFKEHVGINFSGYLRNLRIKNAKLLLQTTNKTVKQIAKEVGYPDDKMFSKLFKKDMGMTPNAYRREKNEDIKQ